jgi:drug/metabolite transporter (DMT)-like permease
MAIFGLMGLMILTGSINTIMNKMQNNSTSLGVKYNHTWFITFCMFVGEITCMGWYWLALYRQKKQSPLLDEEKMELKHEESDKKEATPYHLLIPAICDLFGSTIMTFGLTMMDASIYQMFRGSLILFTALFSVIFLKNKLFRHHYLALVLVCSGLALVGVSSIVFGEKDDTVENGATKTLVGIVLVVVAQLFAATQFIVEEKFMKGYHCHPLKAVGWEGIWGAGAYLVILIAFQFIPCPAGPGLTADAICTEDGNGDLYMEDTIFAFKQWGDNALLCFYALFYIFSIAIFNFVGISVSKYASSPARAVIDTIRTVVIWAFFLIPITDKPEKFQYLQLIGFILLIIGTVIYNEVVEIPFMGFNANTKKSIKRREEEIEHLKPTSGYSLDTK